MTEWKYPNGWVLIGYEHWDEQHVIPVDDLREHEETPDCWCRPVEGDTDELWVHNSADGREEYEEGRRKAT